MTLDDMSFGEALRAAREERGWSRERLIIAIRARAKDPSLTITAKTIICLEIGQSKQPRATTLSLIGRVFPEIAEAFNGKKRHAEAPEALPVAS